MIPGLLSLNVQEYPFELAMCAALEKQTDGFLARQLGISSRIVDVVEVQPGPAFTDRFSLTAEPIPSLAIESDVGVGEATYWKSAIDAPSEQARQIVDRAISIGFFDVERNNGREYIRQTARYPKWFGGLRAFENKPDLGRPGDLELQLRKDVSLGLFDAVILVTASHVTGAHLNRIPDEIGVWRFFPDDGDFTEIREPRTLETDTTGIEVIDTFASRFDINTITPAEKASLRRRIAERAFGKGWRPDQLPGCGKISPDGLRWHHTDMLPYCAYHDRLIDPREECGSACQGYTTSAPAITNRAQYRDRYTPWNPDPPGKVREQASLNDFVGF